MQIEYTTEEMGTWRPGCPDHPLRLAKTVLTHETGLPEDEHRLHTSIDGEQTPVHALRFPVTNDEWDCVSGFRGSCSAARRTWVWRLAGALLALLVAALWYLVL